MIGLRIRLEIGIKLVVLGLALALTASLLVRDSRPALASHTEILFSESNTTPTMVNSLVLMVDGPPQTLYVWAKNVDDPTGAAAFGVEVRYNPTLISVPSIAHDTAWLTSTGRQAICADPVIGPTEDPAVWRALMSCATAFPPPPLGPSCANNHCSGLLGTITIQPGSTVGISPLTLPPDRNFLVATVVSDPPQTIPLTTRSAQIVVAPCADFDSNNVVSLSDVLLIANRFGASSPQYDLNGNGLTELQDILIAAAQYGRPCP